MWTAPEDRTGGGLHILKCGLPRTVFSYKQEVQPWPGSQAEPAGPLTQKEKQIMFPKMQLLGVRLGGCSSQGLSSAEWLFTPQQDHLQPHPTQDPSTILTSIPSTSEWPWGEDVCQLLSHCQEQQTKPGSPLLTVSVVLPNSNMWNFPCPGRPLQANTE